MMNKNIIFCDGGLANRLNTLLFALILKEKFGGNWAISWPVNNWCGASFEELFAIDIPVFNYSLNNFKEREYEYTLVMHENQINFDEGRIKYQHNFESYDDYAKVLRLGEPIIYYHNLIPSFATVGDIASAIGGLKVNPDLLIEAYSFSIKNNIDESVLGLHIRKTDFGNAVDDVALFDMAKNSLQRFFVCSDDEMVNVSFSQLPNCCVYKKKHFPQKMINNTHWNDLTTDDQGRVYNFNINRSAHSVCEALIDLLILSKTTHILTSNSTFLRMSMIFKSINFFKF